ncbi:MAG: response regulator [Gammaproteobacteria bacterium]|jgi:CheY-like chemotaxis protein
MDNEKKTILLIDDVEENREILKRRLEKEGFAVATARNGQEGIDMLEQQRINLIMTDLNMPVMDGHTFLKRIRAEPRFENIPIIIITALDETGTVIKNLRAGACGYLTKPFSMDQIRAQLDLCLRGEIPPSVD